MADWIFDQRWCAPHGIGRFATELQRRLAGFGPLQLGGSPTSPLDPLRLAVHLRRRRAGGYFTPGFNVPAWVRAPVVTTIHDLIHVHFARERTRFKQAYYRWVQRPVVRDSPLTLTVSQYSRREIADWYDVPETQVVCVGNGVSDEFTPNGTVYESPRPYVLYVGNCKPHKNVPALLRAMQVVCQVREVELLMVCSADQALRAQIDEQGLTDRVRTVSGVSDETLATYYRGATALVLPSHYEGFGLPLVEAMACGCPAMGANRTSIPEVIGDAGVLFDPDDVEDLAGRLMELLDDRPQREQLRQRGLERAKSFSWDKVAARVRSAIAPYIEA